MNFARDDCVTAIRSAGIDAMGMIETAADGVTLGDSNTHCSSTSVVYKYCTPTPDC